MNRAYVSLERDGLEIAVSVEGDDTWHLHALLDRAARAAKEASVPTIHREDAA